MKRTPLNEQHRQLGAKLVDFAGWEMPIQYGGVVEEYQAVRTSVGLFDVSHMGRIWVEGRDAEAYLQQMTTNNVQHVSPGNAQYSMVCNPEGGIKDDIFIYRLEPRRFLLCVNASNRDKIVSWFFQKAPQGDVRISDESEELAQIAVQGPQSPALIKSLCPEAATLKPRQCMESDVLKATGVVARTGYTGEVGFELYAPARSATTIWSELMRAGQALGVKACGLGARDLLRLELGYLLYGNDMDEQTTPLEAGAEWVVDLTKSDFLGKTALLKQKEQGLSRKFTAFELLQKGVPRHGMKILSGGKEIGVVTSGNLSPILQKGIGLGYVPPALSKPGSEFVVDIRGREHPAVAVKLPFYKRKT